MRGGRLALAIAVACAAAARDARAWDSICYEYADPTKAVADLGAPGARGCEGPLATHGRWRDPTDWLDEHRALFQQAIEQAGLPAAVLDTVVLAVPTLGNRVDVGGGRMMPQLSPIPLDYAQAIARLEKRGFALDELAQLPDFSYSLADWAGGNERCPVPELAGEVLVNGAIECHRFKTHMGALNASHFPPQSDRWYRWMHQLARDRADQCKAMRRSAWQTFADPVAAAAFDGRWTPIWQECEVEALAIEAVAQHYLQDSWSSGHMWQRWGSGKLADLPAADTTDLGSRWHGSSENLRKLMVGELTGVYAGTIHGSDVPQYELMRSVPLLPQIEADLASYPRDEQIGYLSGGAVVPAAGDMHLHDVVGDPLAAHLFGQTAAALHSHYRAPLLFAGHTSSAALAPQRAAITGCTSGSVREIYDHLADPMTFGAATFGDPTGAAPPPPGPECDAPRLSALAMARSLDDPLTAELKYKLAVWNDAVLAPVPKDLDGQAFKDYDELRKVAWLLADADAPTSAVAELSWPAFDHDDLECITPGPDCVLARITHHEPAGASQMLGVHRNGDYAGAAGERPPGELADPPLPWGDPQQPAMLADGSDQQRLAATFHRAHAPLWCARTDAAELTAFQDRARNAPLASKAEACRLCTEVVERHVRPGLGGKSLCEVLQPGSVVIDGDGDATRVAEHRCGCADLFAAIADNGMSFVRVDGAGTPTVVGGPFPAGSLARDATTASRDRIFIANGQGDLVGFQWAGLVNPAAVELDLTPTDPATTRFHIGGDPHGIAFVESLGEDWLLVVDNASDLLKVYDLGDENVPRFQLCSTVDVGRDPTRVEGAWDLVVKADGSKAYVSIRGGVATPGDAIAMIDLLGLFTCDGQNPPVTHVTTFGGGQGIGAMAFSPDQQYLAVATRNRNPCPDTIFQRNGTGGYDQVATSVGCDQVYVLRVNQLVPGPLAANAKLTFGMRDSFPTRPVSYPYAVAWRPDGLEVAYGSFLGLSPWPLYADMNAQGAVALGAITAPAFPAFPGTTYWSYNAPLGGTIAGETVEFTVDGNHVVAAALDGTIYTFPSAPGHDFWQLRDSDPETQLHAGALLRTWYGGCGVAGTCPGGVCPKNCPIGSTDVQTRSLGSPIRKLLKL